MADGNSQEISRADVYLALGKKPVTKGDTSIPLGGNAVTEDQEKEFGKTLKDELHTLQDPIVSKRSEAHVMITKTRQGNPPPNEIKPH